MSRVVQMSFDLRVFAATLRARHDEHVCTCLCTGDCDGGQARGAAAYPDMDARERKWASQKLLRPIEDKAGYEDFTIDDWLEVARQSWEMRLGRDDTKQSPLERSVFSARQLRHTKAHVRAVWNLAGVAEAVDRGDLAAEGDDLDIDWFKAATDDEDEDYDASDLFDWDLSDLEGEPPHDIGKDAGGNEVKIY